MRAKATVSALLLAVALAGCGSTSRIPTTPAKTKAVRASAAVPHPAVKFNGPKVIHAGSSFKASVVLRHFHIAPNMVGKAPVPGMGHLHFMLDGGKFDYPRYSGPNGQLGKKLGVAGAYSPSLTRGITYSHLPPGRYTLVCMLANNNHAPTGVEAKQTIVVR
jgi:hypothetical protein